MNYVRPVTRLVADSLHSSPWTRSSLSLGRPYNTKYRFRSLHASTRAARRLVEDLRVPQEEIPVYEKSLNYGGRTERGHSAYNSSAPEYYEAWEKPVPEARRREADSKVLVTAYDAAFDYGYEKHVREQMNQLRGRSASDIYDHLRVAASLGTVASIYKVQACVNYLFTELGEEPNLKIYSALILANCRADGSIAEVERLLKEMEFHEGLELDVGACHDLLKVLSVHPDYMLRTEVLQYMRSKWYTVTENGHTDIAAGLFREGQWEFALDKMDWMRSEGIRIQGWLYELALYALGEKEELDEVLRLVRQKVADGDMQVAGMQISGTLWHYLLDVSSRALHYDLASYVWKSRVQVNYLNPSAGTCANVMNLAARNADVDLAQDVFAFLGNRDTVFEAHHYEMILEAYVRSDMPHNALYVLSAMQQANVTPDDGTTRFIFSYIKADASRIEEILQELQTLKQNGGVVPIAVMNVLIEGAVRHRNIDQVIDLYKLIPETCVSPANLATYNELFRACRANENNKFLALTLASEMVAGQVIPNALTYDRMMLICMAQKDYEDGMRYYAEMRAKGMEPRFQSMIEFVRMLTRWGDKRVWDVLGDMEGMKMEVRMVALRQWVEGHLGDGEAETLEGERMTGRVGAKEWSVGAR